MENSKVLVIGSGIIGICCALALQKKGYAVTIVDHEAPSSQTSSGNAGGIAVTEVVPLSMPGVIRNVPLWLLDPAGPLHIQWRHLPALVPWFWQFMRAGLQKNVECIVPTLTMLLKNVYQDYEPLLQAAGIAHYLNKGGSLTLYQKHSTYKNSSIDWEIKRQQGIRFETLDTHAIHDLEPNLARLFKVGVRNLDWGHMDDPYKVCIALFEYFIKRGGVYKQAKITEFTRRNTVVTEAKTLNGEKLDASMFVIAAGVWSRELLKVLDCNVSLESERGYHATFAHEGRLLNNMVISAEGKFVITPMSMGLRVAGTAEFAGLRAAPNMQRTDVLIKKAKTFLPDLKGLQLSTWAGHRSATPDSLPVIGVLPNCANVYCAFGHGHLGLTLGPTTGRLLTDLIKGEGDTELQNAIKVNRF